MKAELQEKVNKYKREHEEFLERIVLADEMESIFGSLLGALGKQHSKPEPTAEMALVKEVCQQLGLTDIPKVEYILVEDPFHASAGPDFEEGRVVQRIRISPAVLGVLGPDKTKAILAHEIAHILHHDSEAKLALSREVERKADLIAIQLGYGRLLADVLEDTKEETTPSQGFPVSLMSHPPSEERISLLRAA